MPPGVAGRDFVLGEPTAEEWEDFLLPAIERAVLALICWIEEGIENAMNKYNG